MNKIFRLALALMALAAICFTACKKEKDDPKDPGPSYDRKAMLTHYADHYILPAYAAMSHDMQALKTYADSFTSAPGAQRLQALRTAWQNAWIRWQQVDLLEFGPAEDLSLRMYINTYPVTTTKVEGNITAGSYDLETFGNKDAQGFAALDYLLNGLATSTAGIVDFYTTDAKAQARKQYLLAVIDKMQDKIQTVTNQWSSYRADFIAGTGTDAQSGFSRMVNSLVLYYERYLRSGKLGLPAGAMTGTARPDLSEAYYSQSLTNELAKQALQSVIHFYEGKSFDAQQDGPGLKDYFAAIGTKDDHGTLLADLTASELNEAYTALSNLGSPIPQAVVSNRPAALAVYEEMQEVVPLLKVDMVSAFGISITYTDNDGD